MAVSRRSGARGRSVCDKNSVLAMVSGRYVIQIHLLTYLVTSLHLILLIWNSSDFSVVYSWQLQFRQNSLVLRVYMSQYSIQWRRLHGARGAP